MLDGNTLCFTSEYNLNCADFFTVFKDRQALKEKSYLNYGRYLKSPYPRSACLTYWTTTNALPISACIEDITVESSVWNSDYAIFVKINKDKKCGLLTITTSHFWSVIRMENGGYSLFALDNTHIVKYDRVNKSYSVAKFPY
eukprot:NODE_861_length_3630_cov_0.140187.p2 type:complete len:142 gc:universal NODE_861_length_3630_cov_0.140187:2671-2246(-)